MRVREYRISYVRVIAILLFAVAVGWATYQAVRPDMFTYINLKENVVLDAGTSIEIEDVEMGSVALHRSLFSAEGSIPGFIAWENIQDVIGLPVTRQLSGGIPLSEGDIAMSTDQQAVLADDPNQTAISLPVDNISGISAHLQVGDRVHLYASFEDDEGAHTGLLLRAMPVVFLQRGLDSDGPSLKAVTISLSLYEATLLTHALHYGKIHLGKAAYSNDQKVGVGDVAFAAALMKTKKRWQDVKEEE
ncbi:hypothetical protein [Brevibacillus daliensis]|uniref:hypothetical protein n=1 Tax=Brevibacillus daliensis TaxID=2892995 RepID=UPI001E37FD86|nr:hypothetical protein [Brevibacillus daliensis]